MHLAGLELDGREGLDEHVRELLPLTLRVVREPHPAVLVVVLLLALVVDVLAEALLHRDGKLKVRHAPMLLPEGLVVQVAVGVLPRLRDADLPRGYEAPVQHIAGDVLSGRTSG
eukprot:5220063-Alexandrium_andersonii.AAC.1